MPDGATLLVYVGAALVVYAAGFVTSWAFDLRSSRMRRIYDELYSRVMVEANAWADTQEVRLNALEKGYNEERRARIFTETLLDNEIEKSRELSKEVGQLKGQVAKLEADRDSMLRQVSVLERTNDVYRATLVMLITQLVDAGMRPNVNQQLLEAAKLDNRAAQLLTLMQGFFNGE